MKLLLTFLSLSFALTTLAQTNIIQSRSHSGDLADAHTEPDNYGMPMMEIEIDSVILLTNTCLIEVKTYDGNYTQRDTICDHPYLTRGLDTKLNDIKKLYPQNTKFKGFKKSERVNNDHSMFFNGPGILGGLLLLFVGAFIGIPRNR